MSVHIQSQSELFSRSSLPNIVISRAINSRAELDRLREQVSTIPGCYIVSWRQGTGNGSQEPRLIAPYRSRSFATHLRAPILQSAGLRAHRSNF